MSASRVVSVNTELVASGIIESEAVILNLSNGMYYSMENVGAEVWQMIEEGRSIRFMSAALSARYAVTAEEALADIEALVRELLEEGLVLEHDSPEQDNAEEQSGSESSRPYIRPILIKYSDMRDVLALDPPLPQLASRTTDIKCN